jgi:hypothetical protein
MPELQDQAKAAVEKLLQSPEDQLFAELGLRGKAIADDPAVAGQFDPDISYDAEFAGPMDALKEFGQRYFDKVNRQVYDLVCGDAKESQEDRSKLRDAFGMDKTTFAAVLGGVLVSSFGWAPAIAAVVAALVVKIFFRPGYELACQMWREKLPK